MRKVLSFLYNVIVWTLMFSEAIVLQLLSFLIFIIAYPFDPKRKALHYFSIYWALHYFWFNPLWKFRYTCDAQIDKKQPYIIVCNHQSMFDIFAMYKIPLIFKWVSKAEAIKIPFVGFMLKLHGDILIKRGSQNSTRDLISQAEKWVKRGCSISIFPEGTRSKDGRIHEFKEGAFLIAKLNKLPILPVVVEGTRKIFPSGVRLGGCNKVCLHVLPIIDAETVRKTKIKDLSDMLHKQMLEQHKKMNPEIY